MPKSEVEIIDEEIAFSPGTLTQVAKIVHQTLDRQTKQGIAGDGSALPPGVDLHDTGAMFKNIILGEDNLEGHIVFRESYAIHVMEKYPEAVENIAPEFQDQAEAEVEEILNQGAFLRPKE